MKNIVIKEAAKKKIDKSLPANLKIVTTIDEYKDVVGCEKERIVAVRFFARWCKVRIFLEHRRGHARLAY